MTLKCSEKQDVEKTFPWCSSERLTPTWCPRPCSLIQPLLHFADVSRSLGQRCRAAGAAHSCSLPTARSSAGGAAPSPSLGPTHCIDIIQDSLPSQHVHPRYWHLLWARIPWPSDSHFSFLFLIICYILFITAAGYSHLRSSYACGPCLCEVSSPPGYGCWAAERRKRSISSHSLWFTE